MLSIIGFVVSSIAMLVISLTMLASANDLRWKKGYVLNFRLFGFILAGVAPFGVVGWEYTLEEWPTIYEVVFRIGLMFVFTTRPYLPPFWRWLTGHGSNAAWQHGERRQQ